MALFNYKFVFLSCTFFFLTGLTSFGEFALWRRLWKECLAKILGHEVYSLSPFNEPKKTKRTCWLKLYPIFLWHLLMQANAIIAEHRNMECYASLSSPRLERRITLLCGSQNFFFPCKGFFKVLLTQLEGLWIKALASAENEGRLYLQTLDI